jgi:hypothetical protein
VTTLSTGVGVTSGADPIRNIWSEHESRGTQPSFALTSIASHAGLRKYLNPPLSDKQGNPWIGVEALWGSDKDKDAISKQRRSSPYFGNNLSRLPPADLLKLRQPITSPCRTFRPSPEVNAITRETTLSLHPPPSLFKSFYSETFQPGKIKGTDAFESEKRFRAHLSESPQDESIGRFRLPLRFRGPQKLGDKEKETKEEKEDIQQQGDKQDDDSQQGDGN